MRHQTKRSIFLIFAYTLLALGAFLMLLPFLWMILTALKTSGEVMQFPPSLFPDDPQWQNFSKAWDQAPFGRYFLNSLLVTGLSTLGELFTTILAAYAFAKLKFRGKNFIFLALLATMMVPGEILTITNYVTISRLKLMNTYGALIIPWVASIYSTYILKTTFEQIPDSLRQAAKVDGCGDWRFLWTIMVPLARPSLVTITLLKVIGSWNAFLWPLLVTDDTAMRTLPVGLQAFTTEAGTHFELLMAASTIVVLPVMLVYFLLQKQIISGISASGSKG